MEAFCVYQANARSCISFKHTKAHTHIFSCDSIGIKEAVSKVSCGLLRNRSCMKTCKGDNLYWCPEEPSLWITNDEVPDSSTLRSCTRQESSKYDSISTAKMINSLIKLFFYGKQRSEHRWATLAESEYISTEDYTGLFIHS